MTETMTGTWTGLGEVTAPSGVLVLGMGGWIDCWSETGPPLSERAREAAAAGGGQLRDGDCEAVAVPARPDRPLAVRALTEWSLFDEVPVISVLETHLGVPWPAGRAPEAVRLGDLPVDRCGMVVGDAVALDAWTGLGAPSDNGLADLGYWGLHAEAAWAHFGGEPVGQRYEGGPRGWLDLPVAEAERRAEALADWTREHHRGMGLVWSVDPHTDYHRAQRAGWDHPLEAGVIEVAGCRVLGIGWNPGDHAARHAGERFYGRVYPVTLHPAADGGTVLRWTIPAWEDDEQHDDEQEDRA
ncbi:hypothetical protein [Streptomyces sp. SKN60]|uniref:hypothetical protein n=1 Tax=Streptomyces sp. SKN60 TaxID=2855506 RepID=UPI002245F7B4|nr:hypothetical protein [Streptomyces sp. SKN60]